MDGGWRQEAAAKGAGLGGDSVDAGRAVGDQLAVAAAGEEGERIGPAGRVAGRRWESGGGRCQAETATVVRRE